MMKNCLRFALLLSVCLVFSALESFLIAPLSLPIPGAKLGLSNLVILFCIGAKHPKEAFLLVLFRSALIAILFGNPITFLFSIAGGLFSFLAMLLAMPLLNRGYSFVTVSVIGSFFFQAGQLLAALFLYGRAVLYFLPLLSLAGIITGAVIGFLQNLLHTRLKKISEWE